MWFMSHLISMFTIILVQHIVVILAIFITTFITFHFRNNFTRLIEGLVRDVETDCLNFYAVTLPVRNENQNGDLYWLCSSYVATFKELIDT